MKTQVAQLKSVTTAGTRYEVTVIFKHNIIHGVLEQTMTFKQARWPKSLRYYVDRELPTVYVDCDLSKVQVETLDVQDGYEHFTVTEGFTGTPKVLGFYSRPIVYRGAIIPSTGELCIFPIQPKSYRVLDGRLKYYTSNKARNYRRGHLPQGHILGTSTPNDEYVALHNPDHPSIKGDKHTNSSMDTFVLREIRRALESGTRRTKKIYSDLQAFEIEVDLSSCTDMTTLKELVRQTYLKEMGLGKEGGVWNLLFLQPAIHELIGEGALHTSSGNLECNQKHPFFETGFRLNGNVSEDERGNQVITIPRFDEDNPQSWYASSREAKLNPALGIALDSTYIEGHYIEGFEALTEEERAAQEEREAEREVERINSMTELDKRRERNRNFVIANPDFGGFILSAPICFETFILWYRLDQVTLPKASAKEFEYYELCEAAMVRYYSELGYRFADGWFRSFEGGPEKYDILNALFHEFLMKISRHEIPNPCLSKPAPFDIDRF